MQSLGVDQTARQPRWTLDPSFRHLNHGSFGAVPMAVQEEQNRLRAMTDYNPVQWFDTLPGRIRAAREDMAGLLHVHPAHLVFVLNASAGASVVYQSLLCQGPTNVLVTNHGYGAVVMGAERLAVRSGGVLRTIDVPLNASADDAFCLIMRATEQYRPSLLVIDQVTSSTARGFPVDAICRAARELGVLTLVDGAHAPGVMADPVCREADYWVGNLHKFACAPRGAAVLVARGNGQELFPLIDSWGTPHPFPERFDYSGTFDATPWLTAGFAWRHIGATIGWDELRAFTARLLDEGCAIVAAALADVVADPLPDVGQPIGPLRLVRVPPPLATTHAKADALRGLFSRATGIAVAFTDFMGQGYMRLSSYAYNTIDDYEYLASVGIPLLHRWSLETNRGSLEMPITCKEDSCERS